MKDLEKFLETESEDSLMDYIRTTEKIFESWRCVLEAVPDCPMHGSLCAAHALEWITGRLDQDWTIDFPIEPGDYWFYGWCFGRKKLHKDDDPELLFIKAKQGATSLFYNAGSHFLYEREAVGMWTPVRLPTLPDLGGLT